MSYTKIVQIGAAGNVGTPVLEALVASGKFQITVVARHTSNFVAPADPVEVVKVDFSNKEQLVNALKGKDAVVITMGDMANLEANSKVIIDAAVEAGVKRILPSEYGNDLANSPGREEMVFTTKHKVLDYLAEKAAEGSIEYTSISNGPLFDWGLTHQFLGFDVLNRKATIYNGGDLKFNTTTTGTVGAAVVSVLSDPASSRNQSLRISDFFVTQNEVLAVLEAEIGSKFAVTAVDIDRLKEERSLALTRGEWTLGNIYDVVKACIFGSKSSARWGEDDDSKTLGLPKKDLKEEIKKALDL